MKKEEIKILLQRAEETKNEMFESFPTDWKGLNFLAGKIFAYKNVLIILEKEGK